MELFRDVLDSQLIDCEKTKMGRVDGIVLSFDEQGRPCVDHLEMGFTVLARRIHPRLETWLRALRRRWSIRRSARYRIPWSSVIDVGNQDVQVDVKASETPAFAWEHWFRRHLVNHVPHEGKP